jgi:hypothetical protein
MNNSPVRQVETPTTFPFTGHEIARLTIFRAAVAAGLYGDGECAGERRRLPFSARELIRLATYRAAIQAGFYTDFFAQGGRC